MALSGAAGLADILASFCHSGPAASAIPPSRLPSSHLKYRDQRLVGVDRVPALGWLYSELACLSFEEFPMDRMATEILRFAPRGE